MIRTAEISTEEKVLEIVVSDITTSGKDWDTFVEAHPCGHHAQTNFWAVAKMTIGWKGTQLVVREQNQIVAGAQLLLHPIPVLGNIGYVIKAPLYPLDDNSMGRILLTHILKEASRQHCFLIVIQPPDGGTQFSGLLQESGFQASVLIPEHASTLILDLSVGLKQIKAGLKRQTYQSIRRSEREGIQVREGSHADLTTFYSLHLATSKRQAFYPYPLEYFETLWQALRPRGHISLMLAEYQGEVVSTLLLICFRNTVFAYVLGWSGLYSHLRPNHALFWGAIQWAEKNAYKYFDFGGVDPLGARAVSSGEDLPENLKHSPDFLKYGFGGKIIFYPGAYDFVNNRFLHRIYRKIPKQINEDSLLDRSFSYVRKILMRN